MRQDYAQSVLISKSIAKQLFPRQDAVNGHVMWTDSLIKYADISPAPRRIVGVAADVDDANIIPQRNMTIYQPFAQGPLFGACLVVRAKKGPYALVPTIAKTVRTAAATQPVEHPKHAGSPVKVPQRWRRNERSHWELLTLVCGLIVSPEENQQQ